MTKVSHDLEEFRSVIKRTSKGPQRSRDWHQGMAKLQKWWKKRVRGVGGKHLRRAGETIPVA